MKNQNDNRKNFKKIRIIKLVPRFIEIARKGGKFPVQGSGAQLRSWLYVDDASEGIRLAVEKGGIGEIYNLGTYVELNGKKLYKILEIVLISLGPPNNCQVSPRFSALSIWTENVWDWIPFMDFPLSGIPVISWVGNCN